MKQNNSKYLLAGILSTSIWGTVSIPLNNIKQYTAEQILSYRAIISLLLIGCFILIFNRKKIHADLTYLKSQTPKKRTKIFLIAFAMGVLITANWYSFIYATKHISLKSGALAYILCPLITAGCSFIILKESLSTSKIIAIGMISLVSLLLALQGSPLDVLWATSIASLFGFYVIAQRIIGPLDKINLLGVQMLIATLLILPILFSEDQKFPLEMSFWINIFIISALHTVLPLFLCNYSLKVLPSSTFGVITYLNPIVAFSIAFIYFNEKITPNQIYTYSLLLVSIFLFNRDALQNLFSKSSPKL